MMVSAKGVVVAVADRTNRGDRAGLGQAFGVANRRGLAGSVGVMHQPVQLGLATPDGHLQRVQARSVRSDRAACQPATKRLKASMTKATSTNPDQVAISAFSSWSRSAPVAVELRPKRKPPRTSGSH
jgi:hypothetical protein